MPEDNRNIITDEIEIKKILKNLRLYKSKVNIIIGNRKIEGYVKYVGEYAMEINLEEKIDIPEKTFTANMEFEYEKALMVAKLDVVDRKENVITSLVPMMLKKLVKRRYPRKNVYGQIYMRFYILKKASKEDASLLYNIEKIASPNLQKVVEELLKDVPNIKNVIGYVLKEIKEKVSPNYKLIFYKPGQTLSTTSIIVKKYNKPLLVERADDLESYLKDYPNMDIITYGIFMRDQQWHEDKVIFEAKKQRASLMKSGIKSLICAPLKLFTHVIGFLWVYSFDKYFSPRDAIYVNALGEILCESFAKVKIKSMNLQGDFSVPVIDISAGGLKFEIDNIIGKFLQVGDELKMEVKIGYKIIPIVARVNRIDYNNNRLWVAVEYVDIEDENRTYINQFVTVGF